MPASPPNKSFGAIAKAVVFLFGLPFVGGGLMALYAMTKALRRPGAEFKQVALMGILGLAFTGAGGLLWLGAFFGSRKATEDDQRAAAAPDQPWLWRADWAQGRTNGSNRTQQRSVWLFAIFWNLVSSPILFLLPREIADKPVAAVGLLFPLVGAGTLIWAIRASMRARRFGATYMELSPLPAVPGGRLSGDIRARFQFPPPEGVQLKLSCLNRIISGSGKNRSTREDIVWQDDCTLKANEVLVAGGEASIPVRFNIPEDAQETTAIEDHQTGIFWNLAASAKLAGIDYQDDFEIPVYRTGAIPATGITETVGAREPIFASDRVEQAAAVSPAELARSGIAVVPGAEGIEYRFAAGRNRSFAAGTTLFLVLWTCSIGLMLHLGAPWFFVLVFGFFELLMIMVVGDQLFGRTTLTVGNGVIRRHYSMLGIGGSTTVPFENIAGVDLHINMQVSGRRGTPYYAVRANFINGRIRDLVSGIANRHHAEWLAAELRRAVGLPRP